MNKEFLSLFFEDTILLYILEAMFIKISNNKEIPQKINIIIETDDLFGVSMNEHGISKITTLKL